MSAEQQSASLLSVPVDVLQQMLSNLSTACRTACRTTCRLLSGYVKVPVIRVDVSMDEDGEFEPDLPSRLPEADWKGLRMCLWNAVEEDADEIADRLAASATPLKGLHALALRGKAVVVARALRVLQDAGCLLQVKEMNLRICRDSAAAPQEAAARVQLMDLLFDLPTITTLELNGFLPTFAELNRLCTREDLAQITSDNVACTGHPLRAPHLRQLHVTSHRRKWHAAPDDDVDDDVDDDCALFDSLSLPELTHLSVGRFLDLDPRNGVSEISQKTNTLLQVILPLCKKLQCLATLVTITRSNLVTLATLPCLHTLEVRSLGENAWTVQDNHPELSFLRSLNCRVVGSLENITLIAYRIQALTVHSFSMAVNSASILTPETLPPGVRSLTSPEWFINRHREFTSLTELKLLTSAQIKSTSMRCFYAVRVFTLCAPHWRPSVLPVPESDDRQQCVSQMWCLVTEVTHLRQLTLCGYEMDGISSQLALLPRLTLLRLEDCRVRQQVLQFIVESMPWIHRIELERCSGVTRRQCDAISVSVAGVRPDGFRVIFMNNATYF